MTVGFLSAEKKENGEEGKKHLTDNIPTPTPTRTKKLFGFACGLAIAAAFCLVAFAIGLTLVFVFTKDDSPKRVNIKCDGDCNNKYDWSDLFSIFISNLFEQLKYLKIQ